MPRGPAWDDTKPESPAKRSPALVFDNGWRSEPSCQSSDTSGWLLVDRLQRYDSLEMARAKPRRKYLHPTLPTTGLG
jgi:hypothetical protein